MVIKKINPKGYIEFPSFIYDLLMSLMKETLDLGTLLSSDSNKMRAFKERTKSSYRKAWLDTASLLAEFGMITPCICNEKDFCKICGGSRYILAEDLTTDINTAVTTVISKNSSEVIEQKLRENMVKFLDSEMISDEQS